MTEPIQSLEEILQNLSLTQQFLGEQFTSGHITDLQFQSRNDDARDEARGAILDWVNREIIREDVCTCGCNFGDGCLCLSDRKLRANQRQQLKKHGWKEQN